MWGSTFLSIWGSISDTWGVLGTGLAGWMDHARHTGIVKGVVAGCLLPTTLGVRRHEAHGPKFTMTISADPG